MNSLRATLSGGFRVNGTLCREVCLHDLTGEEQAYLIEEAGNLLPACWTTEVLHRCACRTDNGEPLTEDWLRSLTVGDREALILQLRRLISGDRLQCVLECPAPDCGAKLDLELRVTDLLIPSRAAQPDVHEVSVTEGSTSWRVRFRLPTGGDQEAIAELARENLGAAVAALLHRLVHAVVSEDGSELYELPEAVRRQLPQLMSEFDPQAETNLLVTCYACGNSFDVLFDAATYFFQELQAGMCLLFHEVHLLAYHYHWSLRDILGMRTGLRRRFLQLLEDELGMGADS
jgi:hypothetical protein